VNVKYIGLSEINGPLVALDHVSGISYDEMAEIKLDDGTRRLARVVEVEKDRAVLQVFQSLHIGFHILSVFVKKLYFIVRYIILDFDKLFYPAAAYYFINVQ